MPQLTFAELIDRDVPLAAGEAVALTLTAAAVADATAPGQQLPNLDQIFLSSTGDVTIASPPAGSGMAESVWMTSLLCGLLRLDEPEHRHRCRGRVPGGLLVLVARMRGQIDLPPLSEEAFRSSLMRFSARAEPALLAAIFWRAARVRSRQPDGFVPSGANVDRRTHGPSASELRKWLRQAEYELFTLQRQGPVQAVRLLRRVAVDVGRAASVVALAALTIAAGIWLSSARPSLTVPPRPGDIVVLDTAPPPPATLPIALGTIERQRVMPLSADAKPKPSRPNRQTKISRISKVRRNPPPQQAPIDPAQQAPINPPQQAQIAPPQAQVTPQPVRVTGSPGRSERPVRTVRLVNLPRASWAVVEESSAARQKR